VGIGHLGRPQKFTIASVACIGTFSCKLALAVCTHDTIFGVSCLQAPLKHKILHSPARSGATEDGGPSGDRTHDTLLKRQVL
jgi:hypothetical protein